MSSRGRHPGRSLLVASSVSVLQPHDVVELRGRHLQDCRVLDGRDSMDSAGTDAKGGTRAHDLRLRELLAGRGDVQPSSTGLDVPRLVLLAVELEAQRFARLHEKELAAVVVCERPDELVAPGLVDLRRLDREWLQRAEIGRE